MSLKENKFIKYLVYAIGEILLITIGVLIAVNINKKVVEKEHQKLRCQYLDELDYTFNFDMKDVDENINAFEEWNPKIEALLEAIQQEEVHQLDSLSDKMMTVRKFIFLGQRTKSKMEELKYSNVDLIGNRTLKNQLLLYQDEQIAALLNLENRYNLVDEEIRRFYSEYIYGGGSNMKEVVYGLQFQSLLRQKLGQNNRMLINYQMTRDKQIEIKTLIEQEKSKNCE